MFVILKILFSHIELIDGDFCLISGSGVQESGEFLGRVAGQQLSFRILV
jgi:hypothetical protein